MRPIRAAVAHKPLNLLMNPLHVQLQGASLRERLAALLADMVPNLLVNALDMILISGWMHIFNMIA